MRKTKEKPKKERKERELRPAARYAFAASFFVFMLLALIVLHILFRNGRIVLKETYKETLLRLKSAYRESSAVVEAFCLYSYKDDSGEGYSCYEVKRVISGENENINTDSRVTVKTFDNAGERHLIYLSGPDEESEKGPVYGVVKDNNFMIKQERIVVDGNPSVPLETLEKEIDKMRSELMIPFQYNYYRSLSNLVKNSDMIIIGKVTEVSESEKTKCMITSDGEKQERTIGIIRAKISILNNLETEIPYGRTVEIILTEKEALRIVDYTTGKSFIGSEENKPFEEGDVCIFFLTACEDSKENIFFLVNEYQGYILTKGDRVFPCKSNAPLSSISSLYGAVETILNEKRSR
ncbi:MAG: hypothetical protein IJM20_03220 [Clostridia bacterium]|nr:hypothetical protein [Clostridia bacterium]